MNPFTQTILHSRKKSLYYSEFGNIAFSTNDYKVQVNSLLEILPELKAVDEKAFIFIDPYEYKHIKVNQIKQLISNSNAEVLLWLPTQFMYRFSANGTPEALMDIIEELNLNKYLQPDYNVWEFIIQLRAGFQSYIGDSSFVDTFTIKKDESTVYCLFFFTSHIRGFEKMLEAKWEIDKEQGKGWKYTENQLNLFSGQLINRLEINLNEFFKDGKKTNGEIYEFTIRQGFLPKHSNEILRNWQKTEKIEVLPNKGEKIRKGAFYISYQHFRDKFDFINIRLK